MQFYDVFIGMSRSTSQFYDVFIDMSRSTLQFYDVFINTSKSSLQFYDVFIDGWAGRPGWAGWLADWLAGPHLVDEPLISIRGNASEGGVYIHVRMNIAVLRCVY